MEDLLLRIAGSHARVLETGRSTGWLAVCVADGHARRSGAGKRGGDERLVRPEAVQDSLEGQLHGIGIGDAEEPRDVAEVARLALLEVEHTIGSKVEGLLDAVLDDDDGVALVGQGPQDPQEARGGRRIQVRQGLVDDVDPGLEHQDAGHREELPLAAREGRRLPAQEHPDPGPVGHVAEAPADVLPLDAQVLGPEGELGLDGGADDLLGGILEDGPDVTGDVAQALLVVGRPATRTEPLSSPG